MQFCDNWHPSTLISNGQQLTILGRTGSFKAFYSSFESACGGKLTSVRGKFASPMYLNSNPMDIECIWEIPTRHGNTISLVFQNFRILRSDYCMDGYLEIREERIEGEVIGRYCGNNVPNKITVAGTIWIKFRYRADDNTAKFMAEYYYEHFTVLNTSSGVIESPPHHGLSNYDLDYQWRIHAQANETIILDLRNHLPGLTIYDGSTTQNKILNIMSNEREISSTGNHVLIVASAQNSIQFRLRWLSVGLKSRKYRQTHKTLPIFSILMEKPIRLTPPNISNIDDMWIFRPYEKSTHIVMYLTSYEKKPSAFCSEDLKISTSTNLITWTDEGLRLCGLNHKTGFFQGTPYLKVDFTSDDISPSRFVAHLKVKCGSNLTDFSGKITISKFSTQCKWRIQVRFGRRIELKVNVFQFPSNGTEGMNFLTIHDGIDQNAPIIKTFRYSLGSGEIFSTESNVAFITYVKPKGFETSWSLVYEEIHNGCSDENIHLTNDTKFTIFSSPNYPDIPNLHMECKWTIIAPIGKTLEVNFIDRFDLKTSNNCTEEYLEIRQGSNDMAIPVEKFCQRPTKPILSIGNILSLKYFTDIDDPHNGFRVNISIHPCGETFGDEIGVIISENYPRAYPRNSTCHYHIILSHRKNIKIKFVDLDLPFESNASENDFLEIQSIESKNNVWRIFGNNSLESIILPNPISIRFKAFKSNYTHRGFKITYEISDTCYQTISADSATLDEITAIPEEDIRCVWEITVPKKRRIKLEIIEFQFIANQNENSVEKYNLGFFNDFQSKSVIWSTNSNDTLPQYLYSTDDKMMIYFESDFGKLIAYTLKMRFSSNELTLCGGDLSKAHGELILPAIGQYTCKYSTLLNDHQTLIFTLDLTAENSINNQCSQCPSFVITAEDGSIFYNGTGNLKNGIIPVVQSSVNLLLVSNGNFGGKFSIHFHRQNCGGLFFVSNDFTLTVPSELERYEITCAWLLKQKNDQPFNISVSLNSECEKEYFKIYNGRSTHSPLIGTFCGNASLSDLVVNDVFIIYHSTMFLMQSNFTITVRKHIQCGEKIDSFPSVIAVRRDFYEINIQCVWEINTKENHRLEIEFQNSFSIEESLNCSKDYLEIQERLNSLWIPVGRNCGRELPQTYRSKSNQLRLIFRSDNETLAEGFELKVSEVCGGIFTASETPIIFKSFEIKSNFCNYSFVMPKDLKGRIFFHKLKFELERHEVNMTIYKQFFDSNATVIYSRQNATQLHELQIENNMGLIFQGDPNEILYEFAFVLDSCGGIITNPTEISNPIQFFTEFPIKTNCIWNITAPVGKIVIINFKHINIPDFECVTELISVYSGTQITYANQQSLLCGKLTKNPPVSVKIFDRNAILVSRITNPNGDYSVGFEAKVFMIDNCVKRIFLAKSNSTYPIAIGHHKNNLNCRHKFVTEDGYYLQIIVSSVNVMNCKESSLQEYFEVKDGANQNQSFMFKFCLKPNSTITSSGRQLYLQYFGNQIDSTLNATIEAVESICGPTYLELVKETIQIASPHYPANYPPNIECVWRIESSVSFQLTVQDFILEEPSTEENKCKDYLEISYIQAENSDTDVDLISHVFCGTTTIPIYYTTDDTSLRLKFKTNDETEKSGLLASLRLHRGCRESYTELQGRIIIKNPLNCTTFISVPHNYSITVHIQAITSSENCEIQNLKIYDDHTDVLLRTICRMYETSIYLFTNTSRLRFQFRTTDETVFKASYLSTTGGVRCGGDLFDYVGTISSPGYPSVSGQSENCTWSITGPRNNRISITFNVFDMGSRETCDQNFVQIISKMHNGEMEVVQQYCADDNPAQHFFAGNYLRIKHVRSANSTGVGWVLEFQTEAEAESNDEDNNLRDFE